MEPSRPETRIPPHAAPVLREVKRIVRRFLPDATLLLYGSQARGTAGPESDWDIVLLTPKPVPPALKRQVRDAIYDLELDREIVISVLIQSQEEWDDPVFRVSPFHESVEREGVLI